MKHLFQLSLLLLALLLPATALAHDIEVDGIYYIINGNEATVTYRGSDYHQYSDRYSGDITIPTTVTYGDTTYSVSTIGWSAFSSCTGLTSIDIPNSVTSIDSKAFYGCGGLTSVNIPNSVTSIGYSAFDGTPWYDNQPDGLVYAGLVVYKYKGTMPNGTNIVIRQRTLGIAEGAFSGCSGLTNIDIPNSVTHIGYATFAGCSGLTNIDIPNSVTAICSSVFYGCSSLSSVNIPNSVTYIGGYAFEECSCLTSIDIPNSVTTIDEGAFTSCGLNSVNIGTAVTYIDRWAFSGCKNISELTWNAINSISNGDMPTHNIETVTIGSDVMMLPYQFVSGSKITEVIIPNSVKTIGEYAFSGCYRLTEIYSLALTPPTIDSSTFNGCYGATLYVPKEAVNAYKAANYWKNFTNIVGVILPGYTFEVNSINYRVTGENMVSVISNAEVEAYYTGDVVIPDSVTYEGHTFAVTGIEDNAFDGCFELTSITIPNSVETICEQAFQGCTGLKSVTIGSGVTAIGAKAFNYCNALETVRCISTVPPVMASADCFTTTAYNRAQLLVPRNTEATYAAADYWYKFSHIDGWGSAGQGDVNGDGIMSILDVTSLIDVLLGNELDSFYFDSADLNINGRIDIGDVTSLIDNLLNGNY